MTRASTVEKEREQLDEMIRLLGIEIDGEPKKLEQPDFVISFRDGRVVGVEIVRALDQYVAGGRGARARIKRGIRLGLEAAGVKASVNVSLHEGVAAFLNVDRKALEREVTAIVTLIRWAVGGPAKTRTRHFEWIDHTYEELMGRRRHAEHDALDLRGTGVEHVDAISISPHDELRIMSSGQGNGQSSDIVQNAINSKVDRLADYRRCGAEELWLLVVGSAGDGGALFVDDVEDLVFTSPYDKTIFLELFEQRCVVLSTTQSSGLDPAATADGAACS